MIDFLVQMLGSFIGGLIGSSVPTPKFLLRGAQGVKRGFFYGGVRVVSGRHPGLSRHWLLGDWQVTSGRMGWKDTEIEVVELVLGSRHDAEWIDILGSDPTSIVTLRTSTAELEWSMIKRFDKQALEALQPPAE